MVALHQGLALVMLAFIMDVGMTFPRALALFPVALAASVLGAAFGVIVLSNLKNQRSANQVFPFLLLPQFFLGLAGMPRRIPDYALQFSEFNAISTIAAFVLGLSQLIFVYNIISCARGGQKATDKVWDGAQGLEWTLPSPPPYHSFNEQPVVK